ncbi:MAG: trypsin-like peptidase domain-containing protein [Chloroflexi bacterium]|nr:trypsin-like peptidase domain-containing protein [Chloroflexota bacterium]
MTLDTVTASAGIAAELGALADRVRPSVVEIQSRHGHGTGIIWTTDGLIVTNDHVAPQDSVAVTLADGRRLSASAVQRDRLHDLVALRVPATDLPAATIGDSSVARIGQLVVAVGNPLGMPRVVTAGIISGPRAGSHGRLRWQDGIQAGIELRPGNSGGPLVNVAGEVIAVNALVIGPRLALSIPSATVAAMLATGTRPRLGLRVQAATMPAALARATGQAHGLLTIGVDDDSPADRAGLLPGDLLLSIASHDAGPTTVPLLEPGDLALALRRATPDTPLTLNLSRAGSVIRCTLAPDTD